MPEFDWQSAATWLCLATAVLVLARRAVRLLAGRHAGGCGDGGCDRCAGDETSSTAIAEQPIVQLDISTPADPDVDRTRS